jgi:hypothetical protein
VQSIALPHNPGEKVTVVMDLDRSTHEIIKHDSVASIETEGVLGSQFVAITFGSAGQVEVKDGAIIQSEPPLQMADLLKKTSGILDSSQLAVQNTVQATAHLNAVSAKIDSGQGTVGALVNDKQLYSNLEQTTTTLHDTMLQAQTGVTDFQENMEALKHNFFLSGYFKKRGYEDSAGLAANKIAELPQGTPLKAFTYTAKQLFDARDSAKLKDQKSSTPRRLSGAESIRSRCRRGFHRHGRRHPEGPGAHRGKGHGCARVSGRELWFRRQPADDVGTGQAGRREPGRRLGFDPDSHLPGRDRDACREADANGCLVNNRFRPIGSGHCGGGSSTITHFETDDPQFS